MTTYYNDYETSAKKIIERVGKNIVMGVPLGLGKPIGLVNAFYRLAVADTTLNLTIVTGLTLSRPTLHSELEQRFAAPILERLLQDYEDPLYEHVRLLQQLPKNIRVIEFFLTPGKYLFNRYVQQNYISSKYTSVVRDALHYGVNVFAQLVSASQAHPGQYSLSCNADLFHDTVKHLNAEIRAGKEIAIVAEVNTNLPFMLGETALVNSTAFSDIVDTNHYRALFALPRDEISPQDHLIGLYASTLIKDDGCLQVGIGKLGNALGAALIMRHHHNHIYQELLNKFEVMDKFGAIIKDVGETQPFKKGIYASTEMFSDEYIELYKAGILKKRVYDHIGLQRLLNQQQITETVTPSMVNVLVENKLIQPQLTAEDLQFLQKFGILRADITYQEGDLLLASGEKLSANLNSEKPRQQIFEKCLGNQLKSGKILHGAFFLGSNEFYQALRNLPENELQLLDMAPIMRTNTMLWSPELAQLQRQHARFVNTAMMVTLSGALVSDGLDNLQEVSGVGGQFDFVNMAQSLIGARSIINCHATRQSKNKTVSNIVWKFPNITIARYLRDIVITEYGIADCRSKTDADVIKSILNITDSRFQQALLAKAKQYDKIELDYVIPKQFQNNLPEKILPIVKEFQVKGYCKPYPFGSDLTDEEQILAKALLSLKSKNQFQLLKLMLAALFSKHNVNVDKYLVRMKLDKPKTLSEFIYYKLLSYMLARDI